MPQWQNQQQPMKTTKLLIFLPLAVFQLGWEKDSVQKELGTI